MAGGALGGMGELREGSVGTGRLGLRGLRESRGSGGIVTLGGLKGLGRGAEIQGSPPSEGGRQCPAVTRQHQSKGWAMSWVGGRVSACPDTQGPLGEDTATD